MKAPIKSVLSIALALAANQAFALGLGPIQIKSGLNQPLVAEIPVIADSAADAEDLHADLASAEDFQRVGLNRSRVTVPIEFTVAKNANGQQVIRLTTKDAVREPFLDFLVAASWSKGKLLREYTILLDPPVTAPAIPVTAQKPGKSAPVGTAPRAQAEPPRASAPASTTAVPSVPSPHPAQPLHPAQPPAVAPVASGDGKYTVQRGDTLSQIANEHFDDWHDYDRMLVALYKANPKAFVHANMNLLKTGAVLRIPSAAEVRAVGSRRKAAAEVSAQYQAWHGSGRATLVGNVGATEASSNAVQSSAVVTKSSEHLALVPPSASSSDNGESRSGSGGGKDSSSLRADLARTKEALSSRDQETTELKSRVSQLEDINNKSQRLISLKDSEIAELQNKLKQLGAAGTGAGTGTEAGTGTGTGAGTGTKPGQAPAPAPAASSPPAAAPPPASTPPAPTASSSATPPPPAPQPSSAATTPASPPATAPKPPAQPAAAKAAPANVVKVADDNSYWLYGGGGIGILILIGGWLFVRKNGSKAKPKSRLATASEEIGEASQAAWRNEDDYGSGAMDIGHARHGLVGASANVALAPAPVSRQRASADSAALRESAERSRPSPPEIPSPASPPRPPRNSDLAATHPAAQTQTFAPASTLERQDRHAPLSLDLDEPLSLEPSHEHAIDVDESEPELAHEASDGDHGLGLADEDTVGTRLDLARAYLDMGDSDGARSMLGEVLAEGNAAQKEEARKLMAEIG